MWKKVKISPKQQKSFFFEIGQNKEKIKFKVFPYFSGVYKSRWRRPAYNDNDDDDDNDDEEEEEEEEEENASKKRNKNKLNVEL